MPQAPADNAAHSIFLLTILCSAPLGTRSAPLVRRVNPPHSLRSPHTSNSLIPPPPHTQFLAAQDVNADPTILPGVELKIRMYDHKCQAGLGIRGTVEVMQDTAHQPMVGLVDGGCSGVTIVRLGGTHATLLYISTLRLCFLSHKRHVGSIS